jgi:hypothetical protein
MSADEPTVKVWKVRVILYGVLLAIGVIVLAARPGSPSEAPAKPLVTLRGRTAQGSQVWIGVQDRHVRNLYVTTIKPECGSRVSWYYVVGLGRSSYSEAGDRIDATRIWDDAEASVAARVSSDGHKIDGALRFRWYACHGKPRPPIPFSASG